MTKRIRLNGGHSEIVLAGQRYLADEDGCFNVPDTDAPELLRVNGGKYEPGIEGLIEAAELADVQVDNLRTQLDIAKSNAEKAHEAVDNYMAKSKVPPTEAKKQQNQQQQGQKR